MRKTLCFFLLLVFFVGCTPQGGTPKPLQFRQLSRPLAQWASPPPFRPKSSKVCAWRCGCAAVPAPAKVEAGATLVLEQLFEPEIRSITRRADGSIYSTSSRAWENAPVAQMRTCLAVDERGCTLGEWRPFQKQLSQ